MLRTTLNVFPNNRELFRQCKLPLILFCQPFADEQEVYPLEKKPARCKCGAYIHPNTRFADRTKWICSFCNNENVACETYGKEMTYTSVVFAKRTKSKRRPAHIFVLDAGLDGDFITEVCDAILAELDSYSSGVDVGFVTYDDKSIQLYQRGRESSTDLGQVILCDLSHNVGSFQVNAKEFLLPVKNFKQVISNLLEVFKSGEHLSKEKTQSCALGPAVRMAYNLAKARGGRITILHQAGKVPDLAPGSLKTGSSTKAFYRDLGLNCYRQYVAVDLFLLGWADDARLDQLFDLARNSGGRNRFYCQPEHLRQPLRRFIRGPIAWNVNTDIFEQAGTRISCSYGNGHGWTRNGLPIFHPDDSLTFGIQVDGELSDQACFQLVQRYQQSDGTRLTRIHNISLPVTQNLSDLYNSINHYTLAVYLAKVAADQFILGWNKNAEWVRNKITKKLNQMLSGGGWWNVEKCIRDVAYLLLSPPFRSDGMVPSVVRATIIDKWKALPLKQLTNLISPKGHFIDRAGSLTPLTSSSIRPGTDGILLLDSEDVLYIIVGNRTEEKIIKDLFGVDFNSLSEADELTILPGSFLYSSIANLISPMQIVQIIKEGSRTNAILPFILPPEERDLITMARDNLSTWSHSTKR